MNAIPAKVAGVERVVMVAPAPGGEMNPAVLAAAALAGVDEVFTVGGAQAVAALAYGTANIAQSGQNCRVPVTASSRRQRGQVFRARWH
jgi:histidinol dehydrogenase